MNSIIDAEFSRYTTKLQFDARKLNELEREGKGYDLMKTLQRIEVAAQLAQQRLSELP